MIKQLTISGFRGFGEKQTVSFSLPDGHNVGSGLNIITGANNSGKTTIIEAIRAFNGNESPSFSEGKRNTLTGGVVYLELVDEKNHKYSIESLSGYGSSTRLSEKLVIKNYVLQSRRAIPFEFYKDSGSRESFMANSMKLDNQRTSTLNRFEGRLFQIEKNKDRFDEILWKILGKDFQWMIELRENGQFYVKYSYKGITHSSEGIGDGIWSIFTICAALYDAPNNTTVVIDEPELSVHPALQRKLMSLLMDYSKSIQIIICTHSPYFINWNAIANGASLIRVKKDGTNSKCYSLKTDYMKTISGFLKDINNPHVLGIEANESFFLEDGIVLVEGQEDVVIYNRIVDQLSIEIKGEFYGWGVGGAEKMNFFLELFKQLGYKKVAVILDGDKNTEAQKLKELYDNYKFITLPVNDIRDKPELSKPEKKGITDSKGKLKDEYKQDAIDIFQSINSYFME